MKNPPITSRIKRSPLLETNGPGNKNKKATASITSKEPDKIETKDVKRKPTGVSYAKAYKNADKSKYPTFEAFKKAAEDWNAKNSTTTETKIIPGGSKKVETDLYEKQEQHVMQPEEVRQQSRATKKSEKDLRRAKIREGNLQAKLDKAEPGSAKARRLKAKIEEQQNRKKAFQSRSDRQQESQESGKRAGSTIRRAEDRLKTRGDYSDEKQLAMEAGTYSPSNVAKENNIVTSDTAVPEVKTTTVDAFTGEPTEDKSSSPAGMKPSAFKMYGKSPAVKTLQGNQNKLPQHLQDAIKQAPESPAKLGPLAAIAGKAIIGGLVNKALSSNKMKSSGFKMKGYGKK